MVHCLRRHAQLGGWVPPGLGWGLFPGGRASNFLLASASAVATADRVQRLRAYGEALATGKCLRMGHGNAFLGFRHGYGAHAQVLALSCNVLARPKKETECVREKQRRSQANNKTEHCLLNYLYNGQNASIIQI